MYSIWIKDKVVNPSLGMNSGPALGGGLGVGMGNSLDMFGQKKTNTAGSLGPATQQAFQQAAAKTAKTPGENLKLIKAVA